MWLFGGGLVAIAQGNPIRDMRLYVHIYFHICNVPHTHTFLCLFLFK